MVGSQSESKSMFKWHHRNITKMLNTSLLPCCVLSKVTPFSLTSRFFVEDLADCAPIVGSRYEGNAN